MYSCYVFSRPSPAERAPVEESRRGVSAAVDRRWPADDQQSSSTAPSAGRWRRRSRAALARRLGRLRPDSLRRRRTCGDYRLGAATSRAADVQSTAGRCAEARTDDDERHGGPMEDAAADLPGRDRQLGTSFVVGGVVDRPVGRCRAVDRSTRLACVDRRRCVARCPVAPDCVAALNMRA